MTRFVGVGSARSLLAPVECSALFGCPQTFMARLRIIQERCHGLWWKRGLVLLLVFIVFSVMITLFPMAFIYDLGIGAAETTVQSPQWSEFLVRITLLTFGGVVAMIIVISLLERIVGPEDRI